MSEKYYSIAESKNRLPAIIHEAEKDEPIFIHRRGKAVAVLLSVDTYNRLLSRTPAGIVSSYLQFRSNWEDQPQAFIQDRDMSGLRDTSPFLYPSI